MPKPLAKKTNNQQSMSLRVLKVVSLISATFPKANRSIFFKIKMSKMPTTELVVLIGRDAKKKIKLHSIRLIGADIIDGGN